MDGLAELFWEWAPTVVILAFALGLARWLILVMGGTDEMKKKGWKSLSNILFVVFTGIIISMAFPAVRERAGKMFEDPCEIIDIACRR